MRRTWWQGPSGQAAKVPGKDECKSLHLAMFFQVVVSHFVVTFHRNVCSCLAQEQSSCAHEMCNNTATYLGLATSSVQLPATRSALSLFDGFLHHGNPGCCRDEAAEVAQVIQELNAFVAE